MSKPIIAITMGDPASIGPEITLKALDSRTLFGLCNPIIVGDTKVMKKAAEFIGSKLNINTVESVDDAKFQYGTVDIIDMDAVDLSMLKIGEISAMTGNASFIYVKKVIELALAGKVQGTVTNALNKEALNLAGHKYSGHTEIYAHFTNTKKYTMMLAHNDLRVVHVSTHVSLRNACDLAKHDRILDVIKIADSACKQLGIANPRVGVCGLNPHSGEGGLFGMEEIEEIIPAIESAKAAGILADGPIPPDTAFPKARGGMYDIIVAMYHDQGHIPLKMEGFVYNRELEKWDAVAGVNITLGLPIIRTSVDHGTALDQAYKGTASELSLVNAIEYAVKLSENQ